MVASEARYKPGEHFEEVAKDPLVDISLTDSTELWLVQWPLNQLQPADYNGKEITLKLHHDGTLGSFESSSGKSYDIVSYAAQEPDATVFLPSRSETKAVGKISRRVCLVHYPEPDELAKPGFGNLHISSQREGSSFKKTMSRYSGMSMRHGSSVGIGGISHETLGSVNDDEGKTDFFSERKQHKRHEKTGTKSQATAVSSRHSSHASGPGGQITDTSLASRPSQGEQSNKKKKIKVME